MTIRLMLPSPPASQRLEQLRLVAEELPCSEGPEKTNKKIVKLHYFRIKVNKSVLVASALK